MEADRADLDRTGGLSEERGFRRVFCAGLALDFCVAWTALDAARPASRPISIEDASRAIDTNGSLAQGARRDLRAPPASD